MLTIRKLLVTYDKIILGSELKKILILKNFVPNFQKFFLID